MDVPVCTVCILNYRMKGSYELFNMEFSIIKLVFSLIIFLASVITLTAVCTGSKKKSKLPFFKGEENVFFTISIAVCLGIVVCLSLLGILVSMAELGLAEKKFSIVLFAVTGVLIFLLIGYLIIYKVRLCAALKERY